MSEENLDPTKIIVSHVKTDKLVYGAEQAIKLVKQKKADQVFMCSNVAKDVEEDLNYYGSLTGITVHKLDIPNDDLGTLVKKPFSISVITLIK